jgi:hypothetical protein
MSPLDTEAFVAHTRRWIAGIVIGLNLCPFARRVFEGDKIRYVVSDARDEKALLNDLTGELRTLADAPFETLETTLVIHPHVLSDFLDYNDFLDQAEHRIEQLGLTGVIQLASFHPKYQFADTPPDAAENYTNRSPYPMLHLLREASITAVAQSEEELLAIPERNIETLRILGHAYLLAKLDAIRDDRHETEQDLT